MLIRMRSATPIRGFDMSGFGAQRLGYLQEDGSIAPAAYSICLSRFYKEEQSAQFLDCVETRESIQPPW